MALATLKRKPLTVAPAKKEEPLIKKRSLPTPHKPIEDKTPPIQLIKQIDQLALPLEEVPGRKFNKPPLESLGKWVPFDTMPIDKHSVYLLWDEPAKYYFLFTGHTLFKVNAARINNESLGEQVKRCLILKIT